jgi:SRSO17 transposase
MEEFVLDEKGQKRLVGFFDLIGQVLGREERKASYALYAMGLLGGGDRKSMEPIAARVCPDIEEVEAQYQRIQHFVTDSNWDDHAVRIESAWYALNELTKRQPVTHWIIDDTGFLKKGEHSVGVKRQYTGSAGKITNCQVGVSLTIATPSVHLPIDFELYLPTDWTEDRARRNEARIPDDVKFQTKPELALKMIDRALEYDVPPGVVVIDAGYGNSSRLRNALRRRGLPYAAAINATTKVWKLDSNEKRQGKKTLSVADYANEIAEKGGFRKTTWREGTKDKLSALFAARRVLPIANEGVKRAEAENVWLLMEWENGEPKPNKYYFITAPSSFTTKRLVRQVKQRWRTERAYEDLKGQLGLDHFEGRRYRGWHHHLSVALSCYAFIVAEQTRLFPPTDRTAYRDVAYMLAS